MPPNSLRDPKVCPRVKQWEKKVGAHFSTRNTFVVGRHAKALGWD